MALGVSNTRNTWCRNPGNYDECSPLFEFGQLNQSPSLSIKDLLLSLGGLSIKMSKDDVYPLPV